MKKTLLYLLLLPFLTIIYSCNNEGELSDSYGNFEATEIIISSEVSGKIIDLDVEEGNTLKANTVVGQIDTLQLSLNKELLKAKKKVIATKTAGVLAQIKIQNEQKRIILKEKDRLEKLLADSAATSKQLDDINGKIDIIERKIESIRTQNSTILCELETLNKQIERIDDQIRRCTVINPVNGTVLEKFSEQYEIAMPGKALYKIVDLSELELRAYISGDQLSDVKIGQKVEVLIDKDKNENYKLEGTVSWISQQAEFTPKIIQTKEERVKLVYAIKVRVHNDGRLKIGMPGEVNFTSNN